MERNKGVTLIALVITIIVLLILAGVSISILTGDNGVLTKATTVELEYSKAEIEEAFGLKVNLKLMEAYDAVKDNGADISTAYNEAILSDFTSKGYITPIGTSKITGVLGEDVYKIYQVNVASLSDKVDAYGKGTATDTGTNKDVFTLEVKPSEDDSAKSSGQYDLKYYDVDGNSEVLSTYLLYRTNNS